MVHHNHIVRFRSAQVPNHHHCCYMSYHSISHSRSRCCALRQGLALPRDEGRPSAVAASDGHVSTPLNEARCLVTQRTRRFQLVRKENWTHLEIVGNPNRGSEFSARTFRDNCIRIVYATQLILHASSGVHSIKRSICWSRLGLTTDAQAPPVPTPQKCKLTNCHVVKFSESVRIPVRLILQF